MKKQYRDLNYVYLSVRLSASEDRFITDSLVDRVTNAADKAEAEALIRSSLQDNTDKPIETLFSEYLAGAFSFAKELLGGIPDLFVKPYEILRPLQYVYDAQNLKSILKCDALGTPERAEALCLDCGTVPTATAMTSVVSRTFSSFPPVMAEAAAAAVTELAASHDPQCVDRLIDKAAFTAMTAEAKSIGIPYLCDMVAMRADCVNIKITLRCIRHKIGRATLEGLLVDGGKLDKSFFSVHYAETPVKLFDALQTTDYAAVSDAPNDPEKLYFAKAAQVKRIAFGVERIIGFIIEAEAGIRKLRVAYAAKR